MSGWNGNVVGAYAPACISWLLALAGMLRLEQLRGDAQAQALVPALQWGVLILLAGTLAVIIATSIWLWRSRHTRDSQPAL